MTKRVLISGAGIAGPALKKAGLTEESRAHQTGDAVPAYRA
ncbi:hypothetical protein [Thermomonospora amylolytica]|nr:hypothetical protein [Thermomonospora amylolytica]